jgi:hypothetical protein
MQSDAVQYVRHSVPRNIVTSLDTVSTQTEGLWPLACCHCGFKFHQGHGCLSFRNVASCQIEVSATGRSLVQRSPTECDVSLCVI